MHDEIRHRQARRAADGMDVDHVGQPPPAALLSALAVPDDPLDEKINGFFGVDSGAWFADFCGGSMDMSTRAGVALLEMLLDGESSSAAEGASRAEADGTRPAVEAMSVLSPSLSSSDDDEDDDDHWRYSSSESEDDAADEHWLPSESSSKNSATGSGKKRRRLPRRQQQQQSAAATGQRKLQQTDSVVVGEGGSSGGGNKDGYWCRRCDKVETPLWRAGPEGPKTLCNACGLRYKNGLAAMAAPQTKTSATKRLPTAAKPGGRSAKCKNRPVSASTVLRKKR